MNRLKGQGKGESIHGKDSSQSFYPGSLDSGSMIAGLLAYPEVITFPFL